MNSVAYQAGRRRRSRRRRSSSQTSLPSQTGPMVSIDRAALGVVPAEERQQDADAEVEALEDEVADPEDGDQDEPDGRKVA